MRNKIIKAKHQWLWFIAIYLISTLSFGLTVYALRSILQWLA